MLLKDRVFVLNNLKCGLIGFRGRRNRGLRNGDQRYFAKNCVTSDCSQIWPITCLVPAPVDCWPSHTELSKMLNFMASRGEFLWAGFGNNERLYRRMSTKYKSSKLFWRILEDNKQNKRENWGKETLRICACKSPIAELCATCSWNGDDFLPVLPSLRFSLSNSCLFWWILSANSCLLVPNSIFFWESRKQSVSVK